ncbi:ribonuclease T2-like [Podila horticola]|nr:ribonuclease T2-like [Podila horticola]
MKIFSITTSLTIGLSVVSAHPIIGSYIFDKRDVCPVNVDSCSPDSAGVRPADAFTIHGLWPDTCEGKMIADCDPLRAHDDIETRLTNYPNAPKDFMDHMNTFWPTSKGAIDPVTHRASPNSFWSHEWTKHGTCVSTLERDCLVEYIDDQDVFGYFSKTLELHAKYDLHAALAAKDILPGSTPNAADMHAAIVEAFKVDAQINCRSGALTEIFLNFQVRNVDEYVLIAPRNAGTCKGHILYPVKEIAEPSGSPSDEDTVGDDAQDTEIPSGKESGSCAVDSATVCFESGTLGQLSKCYGGRRQQNQ